MQGSEATRHKGIEGIQLLLYLFALLFSVLFAFMPCCFYKKQSAPLLTGRSCEILFRYFGRFLLRTGLLIEISGFH